MREVWHESFAFLLGVAAACVILYIVFSRVAASRLRYSDLSANVLNFDTGDFPFTIPLQSASKSFIFALTPRSGFGAAISGAVARSSIVLCNSAPADRTVMAASRLLGAMAACVILFSFAAGHQNILESLHQGCDIVICQQIFSILTRVIFLLQFLYKVLQNRLFLL